MHQHGLLVVSFAILCRLATAAMDETMTAAITSAPLFSRADRDPYDFHTIERIQVDSQQPLQVPYHDKRSESRTILTSLSWTFVPFTWAHFDRQSNHHDDDSPKPGPMPTTAQGYGEALAVPMSAAINANKALVQTSIPSSSSATFTLTISPAPGTSTSTTNSATTVTVAPAPGTSTSTTNSVITVTVAPAPDPSTRKTRSTITATVSLAPGTSTSTTSSASATNSWKTASLDQIVFEIVSLAHAQSSLQAMISSASVVSTIGVRQLQAVSTQLAQAEDGLFHKTHEDEEDAASTVSASVGLVVFLTAAFGFAGLAFFL